MTNSTHGVAGGGVRIAILSFAHGHAISYARALLSLSGVQVLVADPDSQQPLDAGLRGRELANALGVPYAESYEDALAWKPHGVIVTSETAQHRDLTLRAIRSGADVLCEKPLATTVEDARTMVEAADLAGQTLMTAYPVRFSPAFQDALNMIRKGALGTILSICGSNNGKLPSDRSWFLDPSASGGGAIVDHVVHCAQLIDEMLGAVPESVRAVGNKIFHSDRELTVETGGIVSLTYPGNVIATIDCSWSWPDSAPNWGGLTLEVVGTRGSLRIAPFAEHVSGFDARGEVWEDYGPDLDQTMIEEFVDAVRTRRSAVPDGYSGLRTFAVVDAALRSARSGAPAKLHC